MLASADLAMHLHLDSYSRIARVAWCRYESIVAWDLAF